MRQPGHMPAALCHAFLLGAALAGCSNPAPQAPPPGPAEVSVSVPVEKEVTDYADFTGRTEAPDAVNVRARVTGYLDKIHFEPGKEVKAGDVLLEIDPRPYKAEYDRGMGEVGKAEAALKFADQEFERASRLVGTASMSREEYEKIVGGRDTAIASLNAAKANVVKLKLDLEFTKVHARISGRVGRPLVTVGNLVTEDTTLLTSIVSQDPMHAYFDVDERTMLHVQKLIREGKVTSAREGEYPVFIGLANEEGFPHKGTIDFVNNVVDAGTGTLQVRGVFANPMINGKSRILSPGLFVRVRLPVGTPHKALLISDKAIGMDQGLKFVWVVGSGDKVEKRVIQTGQLQDGLRVVEDGLKPGERIVVGGLQRVRPDGEVKPKLVDMPVPLRIAQAEALRPKEKTGTPIAPAPKD